MTAPISRFLIVTSLLGALGVSIVSGQQNKKDPYETIYLHDLTAEPEPEPAAPAPRGDLPLIRGDLFPSMRLPAPEPQREVEPAPPTAPAQPVPTPSPRQRVTPRAPEPVQPEVQPQPLEETVPVDAQVVETSDDQLASTAVVGTSDDIDFDEGRFEDFPFEVNVSLREGYDDNVLLSRNQIGSWFTEFGIDASYLAEDPRYNLEVGVFGDLIWFYNRPGNDLDYNIGFNLAGSYRVTPRLTLDATSGLSYRQEPDLTLVGGNSRDVGGFLSTNNTLSATYIWTERFSSVSTYGFRALAYEDPSASAQQDRVENSLRTQFRYLVQPTITAVLEHRFQYITYFTAPRDNHSNFILAGGDFQFAQRLGGSFRGGVEIRDYSDSAGGGGETSPFFETSLTYEYSEDSFVTWTTRYGLEESSVFNRRNRETFRTGLSVNHQFTPRITGVAGFFYTLDDYASVPGSAAFTDHSFDATAAVRYSFSRNWAVELSYIHTEFLSGISIQDYGRNRISLGGVFSF